MSMDDWCLYSYRLFILQTETYCRRWQYNYLHTITLSFKWVKLVGDLHMPVLDFIRFHNRQQAIWFFFQWDGLLFCSKVTRSLGKCMKTWLEDVFGAAVTHTVVAATSHWHFDSITENSWAALNFAAPQTMWRFFCHFCSFVWWSFCGFFLIVPCF